MAFDPEVHTLDAAGFQVDKVTGAKAGIDQAPLAAPSAVVGAEYPKWVKVHTSHIVKSHAEHVSTPAFPTFHIDRVTKDVFVQVADAEEEAKALADAAKPVEVKPAGAAPSVAKPT